MTDNAIYGCQRYPIPGRYSTVTVRSFLMESLILAQDERWRRA